MKTLDKKNIRYNILSMFIYLIGIIIIIRLFTIQIINGKKYLEKSNSRLTRETIVKAPRGSILDRNGLVLAGTDISYSLELYKSKITEQELNRTILNVVNILEKNGDNYNDIFPIDIDSESFKSFDDDEEKINNWLKENGLAEGLSAKEVIEFYTNKYNLQDYSPQDAQKVIKVRYRY